MEVRTMDIHERAGEADDWFETAERADSMGGSYVRLKDGAPDWLSALVREAHGDFLPDDYRYKWTREALASIAEAGEDADLDEIADEFSDAVDVYTGDLIAWLASHGSRTGYVDEAESDGMVGEDASITGRIALGQYLERREVFESVRQSLAELEQ